MTELQPEQLFRYIADSAGEGDPAELSQGALDTPLDDLGYDSLALMEAAARIRQDTGIVVEEEKLTEVTTARDMLELVNSAAG
jgi:act minimal PKS acyl carrier protein